MTFAEAFKLWQKGRIVRRQTWDSDLVADFGRVGQRRSVNGEHQLGLLLPADYLAVDWESVDLHTFDWALQRLREGKKVRRLEWETGAYLDIKEMPEGSELVHVDKMGQFHRLVGTGFVLTEDWLLATSLDSDET